MLSLLAASPTLFFVVFATLVIAIAFHEAAHAYVAHWLGDTTPESQGRLTLNPLVHLDPIGTICLLVFGFGWGKPVQINPGMFRRHVRDEIFVAVAGPLTNILLAVIVALLIRLVPETNMLYLAMLQFITINILLAFFNLLPIPPLDGFSFVGLIIGQVAMYRIKQYGNFMIIGLLLLLNTVPSISNGFYALVQRTVGLLVGT